jgi:hypothetical protein
MPGAHPRLAVVRCAQHPPGIRNRDAVTGGSYHEVSNVAFGRRLIAHASDTDARPGAAQRRPIL